MNLTLLGAIVSLAAWIVLLFGTHNGSGPVQVLWAIAVILFARRVLVGAPRFLS
ncbi:MAG TPA: hypothetical protein VLT79_03180 [Gemmatimonadales bacterium]|nr:hypothetical protein [Gemmatimonadales bacterium]